MLAFEKSGATGPVPRQRPTSKTSARDQRKAVHREEPSVKVKASPSVCDALGIHSLYLIDIVRPPTEAHRFHTR